MLRSLVVLSVVLSLFTTVSVLADQVITPRNQQGWGDANATDALLKMNRDPEIIQRPSDSGPAIEPACTDENGKVMTATDAGYSACLQKARAELQNSPGYRNATATTPTSGQVPGSSGSSKAGASFQLKSKKN